MCAAAHIRVGVAARDSSCPPVRRFLSGPRKCPRTFIHVRSSRRFARTFPRLARLAPMVWPSATCLTNLRSKPFARPWKPAAVSPGRTTCVASSRTCVKATTVALSRLIGGDRVFHFEWQAKVWIPMVQFDLRDLSLKPGLQEVRAELGHRMDDWSVAIWPARPNDWLSDPLGGSARHGHDRCPAGGAREPVRVLRMVERPVRSAS